MKRFIFKHCWWLIPLVGALAAGAAVLFGAEKTATLFGSIAAGTLSALYFVQQQKLAEMNLFKQLILEFTSRYDRLNRDLAEIRTARRLRPEREDADAAVVADYFNLCAEQFLFFSEGYIDDRVWRAWCLGMLHYFEVEPFASLLKAELALDSYYGLTIEDVRNGSHSKKRRS